jgi:hypothetical protein
MTDKIIGEGVIAVLKNQCNAEKKDINRFRNLKRSIIIGVACLFVGEGIGGAWVYSQGPNIPFFWEAGWGKHSYTELLDKHSAAVATHNADVATHNADVAVHNKDVATHNKDIVKQNIDAVQAGRDIELIVALQETVAQQKKAIDNLRIKMGYKRETEKAVWGILFDAPWMLDDALSINKKRPDGFAFKYWSPAITERLVQAALKMFNTSALHWVTQQPEWHSVLSPATVKEVNLFLKDYTEYSSELNKKN